MIKLASTAVAANRGEAELALYHGDIIAAPLHIPLDLLVVSAFPGHYEPVPGTVVGSLHDAGVSVADLASRKEVDLRDAFGCWLSEDLLRTNAAAPYRRILCFEPRIRGSAPEVVGDLFRALTPFVLGEPFMTSMAVPLLAAGNQQEDPQVMMRAILRAATGWLAAGLPVQRIAIVERQLERAAAVQRVFDEFRASQPHRRLAEAEAERYDIFLSYSRRDAEAAEDLVRALREYCPTASVFIDRAVISLGASWQQAIWRGLEQCRFVVPLLSSDYVASKVCQEEFSIGMLRHRESADPVLLPILIRPAQLPPHMRLLNYVDCAHDGDSIPDAARVLATLLA